MTWKMLVITVVASLALPALARAETSAVIVYGKAKPHDRDVVASSMTQALRAAAWSVLDPPLSQPERDAIVACISLDRPWPCVAPTARDKGVDRIVVVDVEPDKADKDLVLTGQILFAGDGVPSADRGWCPHCNDAALVSSAGELVTLMLQHATERNPRASLVIRTVPPGAVITLDGKMIGSTDRTVPTTAGSHTVLLQRSGYRTENRSVVVEDGKTETIEVTLAPAEPTHGAPAVETEHRSRLLPAVLIGVGALALVAGAIVSYETDPPKTFNQPTYLYNGPAIGVSIVGAAALGVGVYLWFRPGSPSSIPTVAPAPGGGVVGWTTTF